MSASHPIILVTGANGGVGLGICKRLLFQLSYGHPPDAEPVLLPGLDRAALGDVRSTPYTGVTLILACRSVKRAEVAREQLYTALDEELERRMHAPGYDGHGQVFRPNVKIELQHLDLASIGTVFSAAKQLSQKRVPFPSHSTYCILTYVCYRYPYISHIICNAGVNSFIHINWLHAIKQVLTNIVVAVSVPRFNVATIGDRSVDGLGWVWQCNVFGHYALVRALDPLLRATSQHTHLGDARVLWMSSIEATPAYYDVDDWQLLRTPDVYALSKFQLDLIAAQLDIETTQKRVPVRHVLVQPGICATSIAQNILNGVTATVMLWAFYIARWLGSPHHTIKAETAAYSATHLSLVPGPVIPAYTSAYARNPNAFARSKLPHVPLVVQRAEPSRFLTRSAAGAGEGKGTGAGDDPGLKPVRFGSETDRHGNARLGITEVSEWAAFKDESEVLRQKYEGLYKDLLEEELRPKHAGVESFKGMMDGDGKLGGVTSRHA
jgi:3-keto steroid reductase